MKKLVQIVALEIMAVLSVGIAARAADLDQALRTQIMQMYQLDPASYEVEVLSSQIHETQLGDKQDLKIKAISQKEPLGLFSVIASITEDGQTVETGQVSLNIKKFASVLVTQDNLLRHDKPGAAKLTLQRMDITSLPEQPVQSLDAIAGSRLKRNVGKGQILTFSALEPVPDIEVGEEVTIVFREGLLKVTVPGEAMQPGSTGDEIRVRNHTSGKILTGRIEANKVVAVQP